MAGRRPDYRVLYSVPGEGGQKRWVVVGAGWVNDKDDNIGLVVDAIPVNFNGRLLVAKNNDDNRRDPDEILGTPKKGE
jgi:hypothetical protein